jgi:tol-pal system protein YbgF
MIAKASFTALAAAGVLAVFLSPASAASTPTEEVASIAPPAQEDLQPLLGRLDGLESEMQGLHRQWAQAHPSAAPDISPIAFANFDQRLQSLEKDAPRATRFAERDRSLDELGQRLDAVAAKIDRMLTLAEARQAKVAAEANAREEYDTAITLLSAGEVVDAQKRLRAFLTAHPDNELAANAEYWLGETFFLRKDYTAAGWAFAKGYERNGNSPMAADSLLRLGMTFARLDRKAEACATFDKLQADYPNPSETFGTSLRDQRRSAGCVR